MDGLYLTPAFHATAVALWPRAGQCTGWGDVAATRPVDVIGQIAPRAILLIHAADDQNTTTPLSGERRLYAAAGQPKEQWIVPHGGHVGALNAYPQEYQQHVLAFFAQYLL